MSGSPFYILIAAPDLAEAASWRLAGREDETAAAALSVYLF